MQKNIYNMDTDSIERKKVIVRTSIVGIAVNVFLSVFKVGVGIFSNSIAVILDAVNNLSDALSSVITIIGTKLSSKNPDKKHPFGYGRIEYLSSMLVAGIVIYAGITALVESVKKIINPVHSHYGTVSLAIIFIGIIVKLVLGRYVKSKGSEVNSGALVASGADALFDAILSTSVFLSAIIYILFEISLEAYVGMAIALFIIKAGIDMMIDTLDDIIGRRVNNEISIEIKNIIKEEQYIKGVYDLALFNYGPDKYYGSVHIELPDTMTVNDVDMITRKIQYSVYMKTGVIMTGIGVYSYNTTDKDAVKIREKIHSSVISHEWVIQMHGFYIDRGKKFISFDIVLSFDIEQKEAIEIIHSEIKKLYPDYTIQIVPDIDLAG